jgi:two-component system invasion response regulator UvrY
LKYCCSDLTYGQIAQKMNTSIRSVEGCRDRLFNKLNLNSRVALALFAIRFGLVTLETNFSGKTIIPLTKTR